MSQTMQIGKTATSIYTEKGWTCVKYHGIVVVRFNNTSIILNAGYWWTVTTKRRMNQTANQFDLRFRVFQKDFKWFVEKGGKVLDFVNGMKLER